MMKKTLSTLQNILLALSPLLRLLSRVEVWRGIGGGLLLIPFGGGWGEAFSQGFSFLHTNFYHHDSVGFINPNTIWSIYPDTDRIYTNINAGSPNRTYIGAHDYAGNQIFYKKIPFPEDKLYLTFSAHNLSNTITKISDNVYLSAGYGYDNNTSPIISIDRPYLYFFDGNGDSLNFLLPLWMGIKNLTLTAINYDSSKKEIIATGFGTSDTGVVKYSDFYKEYYMEYDYYCYWAAKFTDKGELIWFKEINILPKYMYEAGIPQPYRILPTTDSGYMICGQSRKNYPLLEGYTRDSAVYNYDNIAFVPALTKINKDGNLLWHKHLPRDSFPAEAGEIAAGYAMWDICSDGADGFYFVSTSASYAFTYPIEGTTVENDAYTYPYYYGRLNANGDTLWTKTFMREKEHDRALYSPATIFIKKQLNGDLVIGSTLQTFGWFYAPIRPIVFCTDSTGNVKWYREPRHFDDLMIANQIFTMSLAPNGNIIGGGGLYISKQSNHPQAKPYSNQGIEYPAWLFMLDSNGYRCEQDTDTISGDYPCHEPYHIIPDTASGKNVLVKIYPNPTKDILYIELQGERHKNTDRYSVYIHDITGRALIQGTIENRKQAINLHALSAGIYILRITKDGELIGTYKVSKI